MLNPIHSRRVLQRLLFASCFEDPELDRKALGIQPGHTVLSVTSGGCNALALLLDAPGRLIALDMNPAQNAILQLKIEGIRCLSHDAFLELLGVRTSGRRLQLLGQLRPIPFWDEHPEMIEAGVLNQGRFERFLSMFRKLLYLVQGTRRVHALPERRNRTERERFYDEVWDTPQWRALFRIFFSRTVLGRLGLDPRFFDFVEGSDSFSKTFLERTRHALVELPVHENYFVDQILFGKNRQAFPAYLEPDNFERLRSLVDRIEIVTSDAESYLRSLDDNTLDRINFSNIFEWMTPEAYRRVLVEVIRTSKPRSRMTYRNLLVRRERPHSLAHSIRPDPLAKRLLRFDRAFVYGNFVVEQIIKEDPCHSSLGPVFSYTCSR